MVLDSRRKSLDAKVGLKKKDDLDPKVKVDNAGSINVWLPTPFQLFVILLSLLLSGYLHVNSYPPSPSSKVYRHEELHKNIEDYKLKNLSLPSKLTSSALYGEGDKTVNITSGWMKLSQGYTYYSLYSPPEQIQGILYNVENKALLPPVVLIHGFASSSKIWEARNIAHDIALQSNRQVLIYDNYGRGRSDAAFPNTETLFSGQLAELLIALYGERELKFVIKDNVAVDIMGISMGGSIATSFAYRYPQLVRKVILVAPAGLPVPMTLSARISTTPFLGDWLTYFLGPMMLKKHVKKGYFDQTDPFLAEQIANITTGVDAQVRVHPGFVPSLLSTTRHYPLNNLVEQITLMGHYLGSPIYSKNYERFLSKRAGDFYSRILVIWGNKDIVCPFENASLYITLLNLLSETGDIAKLEVLEDCGHVDMINKDDTVVEFLRIVMDFFKD